MGEITDVRDGTHASPHYVNSGFPLLTSKNISNGCINYNEINYISEYDFHQINERSKVDVNDILMGMIGTIGNLALVQEKPNFAIKNVALIKNTGSIDHRFLFQDLQTDYIERELSNNMDGGTQKFISLKKIRNLSITFPTLLNEQDKIGNLFHFLDSTITLHEEKKRQLERLKSALSQKIFADKSGYPAVRFEGFGGKWDQCKLGNVGTFRGGFGFPENEQGNIDGIAFYKVSDMNDSCNTLTMRKASNYVTSSQISKNKWKPILNQNIIFAKVGAAVYLERKRKAMGPFLLDNNMMAFQPKDADIDYIYYVFQRLRISKHAQVGTLPSLNASELRNITIYIPSLNEQKAVADLMVSLDHTIILYDFKLELLKKLKSSLLQHMFI